MFVQIGQMAFNLDHVTDVWFKPGTVILGFDFKDDDTQAHQTFHGEDAELFLTWWNHKAKVYRT